MAQRSRAQRLNGLFPLSYLGVVPVSPVNFVMDDRAPTINDSKNFYIGDMWLDTTNQPPKVENLWVLVALARNDATWVNFAGGGLAAESFPTDSGTAIPVANVLNIIAANSLLNCGSTVKFTGSGNTVLLNVSDLNLTNTIIGGASGNLSITGAHNVGLGNNVLSALTSGIQNLCLANASGSSLTTGSNNVLAGLGSGSAMTSSSQCVGIGSGSLVALVSGTENLALGYLSGGSYTSSESNNVCIANLGTVGESNVIRIGTQGSGSGQQNKAFMAGIYGVTPSGSPVTVVINSSGQLGTTGGSGGNIQAVTTQVFTSSGTYTPTSGMLYCIIEVVGAGGGGGASSTTGAGDLSAAGGGGAGGYARKIINAATIGASQAVTIGAGGIAGIADGGNGGNGGTTSVGAIISATGGFGSLGAGVGTTVSEVGGLGGAGSSGDFNVTGTQGFISYGTIAGLFLFAGYGASSIYGGGGEAQAGGTLAVAGSDGRLYGAGGGGGYSFTSNAGVNGGAGSAGIVIITEYIS
jgi:hypothetical protein